MTFIRLRRALLLAICLFVAPAARAGLDLCGLPPEPDAAEQRRLLHVSAALRATLQRMPDAGVALVARDGTDLQRWGIRFSHAGLAMREHPRGPWTVRQLYYDCEGGRPRVFDQGLAGFLHGSREPDRGALSVLVLPAQAAHDLQAVALDAEAATSLLHSRYSANAHAFSERYQNCNQWLAELMALAWGGARTRTAAQQWLRESGYEAQRVEVGWRGWLWLAHLSPWLHLDDHPVADLEQGRLRISLPEGLQDWLETREPRPVRLQLCWREQTVVIRRDTAPLSAECVAGPADEQVLIPS